MRVFLVNPPKLNFYRQMGSGLPPLGIGYLAAVLQSAGWEVQLVDLDNDPQARRSVELKRYDLVGISADTPGYPAALEIAAAVRRAGGRVVMGGHHVTFRDWEALQSGVVDYVIRGEGEGSILALMEAVEGERPAEDVPNLSFLQNGKVIRTPSRRPVADLDGLPFPARDLLPMHRYRAFFQGRRATSVITSRGCPFNCSFCASSRFDGLEWRARSSSSIADEVEFLRSEYRYRAFAFMDDNFTLNPERVLAFVDELDRRGLEIIWWCFSRADIIVKHEAMVRRMAEAGAKRVFLGLESGSQEVLNGYGKRITIEQQREAIALLRRYGIETHGGFIVGDPHETREMVEQTVRVAVDLNPFIAQFSVLTPYPGTVLFEQVCREGRLLHEEWNLYDGLHAVMRGDFLNASELQQMLSKAYRTFYLRCSSFKRMIMDLLYLRDRPMVEVRQMLTALQLGRRLEDYARRLELDEIRSAHLLPERT